MEKPEAILPDMFQSLFCLNVRLTSEHRTASRHAKPPENESLKDFFCFLFVRENSLVQKVVKQKGM